MKECKIDFYKPDNALCILQKFEKIIKSTFAILCPHSLTRLNTTIKSILIKTEDSKSSWFETEILDDWLGFHL